MEYDKQKKRLAREAGRHGPVFINPTMKISEQARRDRIDAFVLAEAAFLQGKGGKGNPVPRAVRLRALTAQLCDLAEKLPFEVGRSES